MRTLVLNHLESRYRKLNLYSIRFKSILSLASAYYYVYIYMLYACICHGMIITLQQINKIIALLFRCYYIFISLSSFIIILLVNYHYNIFTLWLHYHCHYIIIYIIITLLLLHYCYIITSLLDYYYILTILSLHFLPLLYYCP